MTDIHGSTHTKAVNLVSPSHVMNVFLFPSSSLGGFTACMEIYLVSSQK